jgi:PAS domain S-box-containing protein
MHVEESRTPEGARPRMQEQGPGDVLSWVGDVLDLAPYAVLVIDDRQTVVLANPRCERIFGCRQAELVGLAIPELVPAWSAAWPGQARADRRPSPLVRPLGEGRRVPAVRKGGAAFQAELLLSPLHVAAGSGPTAGPYTTVVVKDVALRQELQCGAEHLALSQRIALMGSWDNDLTTGQVHFSRQLYRLLNIEPGSITPQAETVFAQIHPADLPSLLTAVHRARSRGGAFFAQVRLLPRPWVAGSPVPQRFAPGELRMVAVQGTIDLDRDGRPVRTFGTVQDVTERVTLERALDASDRRFEAAFDQAPIGMALIDARPGQPPTQLLVNAALSHLTGRCVPELRERTLRDLVHPLDRRLLLDLVARWSNGESALNESVDVRLVHPDGRERWGCLSGTLVRDHDGAPDYVVSHLVDVTDRYRSEADLRRRAARDQRIAAVLQNDLMPWVPPRLGPIRAACRYQPAGNGETICGDWVDVFPLPDGRVGVVVGDVAGHGIEAAATMTRLSTVVRLLATSGVSPAGVMRRLNETLHETDLGDDIQLATLVHGQLDPTTGTLVYSSAGHLPMFTLAARPAGRSAGGSALASPVPAVGGPPIGVIPGWKYSEHAVVLQPGGILIGYTDGLIERRGQDLDESILGLLAGLNALPDTVLTDVDSLPDVESLADAVLAMAPPGPSTDDLAVIVVAFDPHPAVAPHAGTARPGKAQPRTAQPRTAQPRTAARDPGKDLHRPGSTLGPGPRQYRTIDLDDVALPPDRWA